MDGLRDAIISARKAPFLGPMVMRCLSVDWEKLSISRRTAAGLLRRVGR